MSSKQPASVGTTEFDVLKASHKFLRDDEEDRALSWEDQLAKKYYASLYREFAVCDLKHYKSGNFALRWRTEAEVLSGAGEVTCGNTRCTHHLATQGRSGPARVDLHTIELPFAYEERGERKRALVKVVLCDACLKKLMWKREKEKESTTVAAAAETEMKDGMDRPDAGSAKADEDEGAEGNRRRERHSRDLEGSRRRKSSRSLSPSAHRSYKHEHKHRRRSPPPKY